jgi:hypothetical protein
MIYLRRKVLDRRTVLRGLLGGTALSLGLPALEIFQGVERSWADPSAFPKRYCQFFWGNGTLPPQWNPVDTGTEWALSDQLSALAPIKDNVALITGMEVKVPNLTAHFSGPAGFLSGVPENSMIDDESFNAPSLDQVIAQAIGGDTRYRSIEIGIQPGVRGLSFNTTLQRNPPESDPARLFERLFGVNFTAPGEEPIIDPELSLRRSVLDSVMEDARRLRDVLGAQDKQRLTQHLEAVRDLELRLAQFEAAPPNLSACVRPAPPEALPPIEGREQMSARARLMNELSAMAFACDLTRILSIWHSDPVNNILYPEMLDGHHNLTHDEPGAQPQVNHIVKSILADFTHLVETFKGVSEGDGTLLDHCALLATSDVSYGRTHSISDYPIIIAGRCGAKLKNGFHYRSDTAENICKVSLSLLRAVGVTATEFGEGDTLTDVGLSALEV